MPRYTLIHRLLHWTIAVIGVFMLTVGFIFMFLELEGTLATFGKETTDLLYKYHKSFGITVLCLMLVRVAVRLRYGKPEYRPPIAKWERSFSTAVHFGLYGALLVQPVLGWSATAAGGFPIEFFGWILPGFLEKNPPLSEALYTVHGAVGFLILVLVLLHVAGALRHWLFKRDGVMTRMSLP